MVGYTHSCQLVEAGEELVEELHQLLGAAVGGELGEAHDVCEEDAAGSNGEQISPACVSWDIPSPLSLCTRAPTPKKRLVWDVAENDALQTRAEAKRCPNPWSGWWLFLVTLCFSSKPPEFLARTVKHIFAKKKNRSFFPHKDGTGGGRVVLPDVLVTVHVHGVELLHLLLARVLLHVLQHLISHMLGQDGQHQPLLGTG